MFGASRAGHIGGKEVKVNRDAITLQDCIDLYELEGKEVIIEDGHVTGIC